MSRNFGDVGLFHEKFDLDNVNFHGAGPRDVSPDLLEFRLKFLLEELSEFVKGKQEGDIAQMADALIDLVYVAMGTAHLLGLPWEALWADVQEANMKKERAAADGSNSKRGSAWDVVKPEGWEPPHTEEVLERYGWTHNIVGSLCHKPNCTEQHVPGSKPMRSPSGHCDECGATPAEYHRDDCSYVR